MSIKKRSITEWRDIIAQWEASGQTQEEFCLARGINLYTMRDRARRLRRIDEEGVSNGPLFAAKPKRDWVEVKEQDGEQADLTKYDVSNPESQEHGPSCGEIRISVGSFTVSVAEDFSEAAFIRIIKALSSFCSAGEAAR